jgi:sirohydrochlorin cobaltochelatase
MHGAPPHDFPQSEVAELFSLEGRLARATGPEREALERRHLALDEKVRNWPRTAGNDPFWAASLALGEELARATGDEVLVGFNEFCTPSLDEALDRAASREADQVLVVTPMMTRGGEHSEVDIPAAVDAARARHPAASFTYVWPFDPPQVARFLAAQIDNFRPA